MKKSEKRKIGEAKQARYAEESRKSGLAAQNKDHEIRAKRQRDLMRQKTRDAAKKAVNGITEATKAAENLGRSAREATKSINDIVVAMAEGDAKSA